MYQTIKKKGASYPGMNLYFISSYVMHISIIDDEKMLSTRIAKKLRNNGYSASSFTSYHDFIQK